MILKCIVKIAFDIKEMKVGCVLIQAAMGGLDNQRMATYFPTETWALAPTPEMKVYEITEDQLKMLSKKVQYRKQNAGYSLIDVMVTMTIVLVLASLLLPVVVNSFLHCKAWIWGVYAHKNNQIEIYLRDDAEEKHLMTYATNTPAKWSFIDKNGKLLNP
jgi:competence protein ComGC